MKKFTLSRVLDGFRSSVNQGPGQGGSVSGPSKNQEGLPLTEIVETLKSDNFQISQTVCHGFPYQPTAMAFDPVQRLLAIGTKNGYLRILGRPGVDIHSKHEGDCCAILHLQFVVNEGLIVSATADDTIHLWNFRVSKKPEVVQSLKFQRERITCLTLPFQSKWIYVGTERGNVHVVNIDSFQLSGYVISWNKAIEVSRKTHPGSVIFLGDSPADSTKLLIGFESGSLVLWDLKLRVAEIRFQCEPLRSVSWHSDGKNFMASHSDGSITTWNSKLPGKPVSLMFPHSRTTKDGKPEACKSIQKVEWKSSRTGENFVIFSGGLPTDRGKTPSLTVIHGKTTTVLEMEHNVLDFVSICESHWDSEIQDPFAIVVLLQQDLVVIDLLSPGYPCFENPYPMDIHESPVTCCLYMADCPGDLVPALYSVGSKSVKKSGFSEREWPIDGGQWGTSSCSYAEIILTGHADGSIKFWDASSTSLQVLYKLKTSKPFERPKNRKSTESCTSDDDPFAVQYLALCPESRLLAVAGASCQVLVYKFRKQEVVSDTTVLEIPIIWDVDNGNDYYANSGGFDFTKVGDAAKTNNLEYFVPLRTKSGPQKRIPGYQVEIVCLTPWVNGEPPGSVSSLALNSSYGILAYGNDAGLVIVDTVQKKCLMSVATPDLYGTSDPYQRAPKSPKRPEISEEKSPTDQVSDLASITDETQHASPNESVPELFPQNHRQSITGSMGKLPTEQNLEVQETKLRSTTPPAAMSKRNRSATWSQVKGLVLKNVRENKKTVKSGRSTSYPVSPGENSLAIDGSDFAQNNQLELQSPSSDSSSSSSPTSRPNNLDFPQPPSKVKKKKLIKKEHRKGKKCVDLRSQQVPVAGTGFTSMMKKFQKLDTTFSRSRSSSMSSLDNITSESIQCLSFVDSFAKKGDFSIWPTLWVGTSLGSILVISISLPNGGKEARKNDHVAASPSGTIFRIKGPILLMSFLDWTGQVVQGSFEAWRDEGREVSRTPTKGLSGDSDKSSSAGDRQFGVFLSEKQARVVSLPSQTCLYKQQICESSFVIKAEITAVKESSCLVCYASDGHLKIYSLPSLRPLLDFEFVPLSDLSFHQTRKSSGIVDPMLSIWGQQIIVNEDTTSIAKTFCLSSYGHGMFLNSPSEIQKFTVSTDFYQNLDELLGQLFIEVEMPERPKESFFAGLFGVGVRNVDREELFGEAAGKTSRSVAKLIPGPGSVPPGHEHMQMRAGTLAGDVNKTRMLMVERGQKLGDLGDRTEKMANESENFSSAAHQLMLKYKDKKWYQL